MTDATHDQAAGASPAQPPKKHRRVTPLRVIGGVLGLLVLAIVIFLMLFQWDWLRGPIGRFVSAKIHREVKIEGHLKVHLLTWSPTATVGRITVANPDWAKSRSGGRDKMAVVESMNVAIHLPTLLKGGGIMLPILQLDRPNLQLIQDAQKRANWDFNNGRKSTGKAFKLPPIQQFIINDGQLAANMVARRLQLTGTINAREARAGGGGFQMAGQGSMNGRPFLLKLTGGPLLNIRKDRPYPFNADVRAGDTHLTAKGSITKPFDFGSLQAAATITGEDLGDLYYLTGVTLPNSPRYALSAQIARKETRYELSRFSGRVGGSDLEGHAVIDLSGGRPKLTATASSHLLDLKDLGPVFGGGSRAPTAGAKHKAAAQRLASTGRLLPDATLDIQRARAMDAKVDFRATAVKGNFVFPIRGVHLGVDLDHGRLDLDPITLTLPQGQVTGSAQLDARGAVQKNAIDLRMSGVRLQDIIPARKGGAPLEGVVQARARLNGAGNSLHAAASNASGNVTAYVPQGRIKAMFAELAGVNLLKGVGLALSKSNEETGVRCAIADFRATNGVLTAQHLIFDTEPTLISGQGSINLATESMNFRFKGDPKKFQLVRLRIPFHVNGPLRKPQVGIEPGGAIVQAGLAAAIGAALPPLALILPFIDPGLAKDANCGAVSAQAKAQGTPIRSAPTPARAR